MPLHSGEKLTTVVVLSLTHYKSRRVNLVEKQLNKVMSASQSVTKRLLRDSRQKSNQGPNFKLTVKILLPLRSKAMQ